MPGDGSTRAALRSSAAESGQLQTLHRALDVLEALVENGESSVADLSGQLGLARSTTHRLLTTLTTRGYVRQDSSTGGYRIGVRSLEIGSAFMAQNHLRDLAHPILKELNRQFNETIGLAILDGDEAVYVDLVEANQTLRTFARIGARVPLYCTGVGKALLMGFGDEEIKRYARTKMFRPFTPSTITSPVALIAGIQKARATGYVLDREEHSVGVRCGSAPVLNHAGQVIAALSISGPTYRLVDNVWIMTTTAIAAAAREISRLFGFQGPVKR
jgi:IclR family acetate operon transcriptional repressor